jgi:hypothetical protein
MRYLKRQTLNRRVANDPSLYVDKNGQVVMGNTSDLLLPTGNTSQQPSGTTPGRIRYNTTKGNVEVYQGSAWRALRYQEATTIFQQNLGAGDGGTTYFGPLNSTYYNTSNVSSSTTLGGQNILVIVENVIQVSTINYDVVQNPTLPSRTYSGKASYGFAGTNVVYFNSGVSVTGASGDGSTATLTFATKPQVIFSVGTTIVVTGINSTGGTGTYNGTFTVSSSTASSVSWLSATTATYLNGGEVDSTSAIYPSVSLVGGTISGLAGVSGTITGYATDPNTDALVSVTMSINISSNVTAGAITSVVQTSQTISNNSWWLRFSTPVPYGKVVIALLGFDQ